MVVALRVVDARPVKAKVPPAPYTSPQDSNKPRGVDDAYASNPGSHATGARRGNLLLAGRCPTWVTGRHQSTADGAEKPCAPHHFPPASRGPGGHWGHQNRLENPRT